jgi:hypothetical protein
MALADRHLLRGERFGRQYGTAVAPFVTETGNFGVKSALDFERI